MGQCLRASAFGAELRAAERAGEKDLDIRNKWLKENIRKGATLKHTSFAVEPVLSIRNAAVKAQANLMGVFPAKGNFVAPKNKHIFAKAHEMMILAWVKKKMM